MISPQKKNIKKDYKIINFNHLMSIYETNYYNFVQIFKNKPSKNSEISLDKKSLVIEDIFRDKYTRIFKMYYKFKYDNSPAYKTFSIKSHLIFYMYNDAQLLEVKSLNDNKTFHNSISQKIKLNLNLFYLLKSYINQ